MARHLHLGGLTLPGLLLTAGCAQLQWTSEGPGAPGTRPPPAPVVAAQGRGDHVLPELPPAPPLSPSDRERVAVMQPWVEQTAHARQLDPDLINGVIWVESRFDPRARSSAGARGLMQLMPATAAEMAKRLGRPVARVYDPELNIEMGSLYLLLMLDRFDGDETLALAAYNAGAGNVARWMAEDGELPPHSLQYVENVQRARLRFVAMRQDRHVPGTSDDRTLLASGPAPRDQDPPALRPAGPAEVPPAPAERPLDPPAPAAYRPATTPEPPLAETPYPPLTDEPRRRSTTRPVRDEPGGLPSVLD